jgi:multiple sugar transport system permease protein
MPLIGKVGRKRFRARLAMATLYLLLSVGAITTLYPFSIMVSTGFKGPTDQNDNRLVPGYWKDDEELLTKYLDDKYAGNAGLMATMNRGAEADAATVERWNKHLESLDPELWIAGFRTPANGVTSRLNRTWQNWLRQKYGSIEKVNELYIELNSAFQTVSPPPELRERVGWKPKAGPKYDDWMEFKRSLPAEFRIPVTQDWVYAEWMRGQYRNDINAVPASIRGAAKTFEEIRAGTLIVGRPPVWWREKFADTGWTGELPIRAAEKAHVAQHGSDIKSEFSQRNYAWVLDYILLNGRALWNTLIFCTLAILVQLLVNPLAAYALSRFPMKATARILLFLLATMAFPAEVAMIPSFLVLKDLGLLNTFAALVLPGAASGYMIFLLKGFFDSLPREIFESGQLDGAPETTMMLRLAFPLSRPVLGYLALLAFMGAYGAFMYAFLVAQSRDMWTLSVFIYQLQGYAPKAVMMAAITLAALPTLIVFLLAQRVIMRGIVLPGER